MAVDSDSLSILHILGPCRFGPDPDKGAISGAVRVALELARRQVEGGHRVWVATVGREGWWGKWYGVRLVGLRRWPWARARLGGRELDLRRHLPLIWFTLSHDLDLVHCHLYNYTRFLRTRRRVVHFHTDPYHKGGRDEGIDLKAADFELVARTSHAQIGVSKFIGKQLQRGLGEAGNVRVVYNGVDGDTFDANRWINERLRLRRKWNIQDGDVAFLFAGAIVPEKGVIHLAKAFTRLAVGNPNVHLILAGSSLMWGEGRSEDNQLSDYERLVRESLTSEAKEGRIHFLGQVPSAHMPAVHAASEVFVLPSVWREPCPLVALEALATGRPVIASRVGGLEELVNRESGFLVEPGDEEQLETAMHTLAEEEALRARLGAGARQQVCRFTWETACGQVENIYREILA